MFVYIMIQDVYKPMHFCPFPVNPDGQGPQMAPMPGAGLSMQVTPVKQLLSTQPSTSS